jgi:hypothetical protein
VEDERFAPFWAGRFTDVFFGDPQKLRFTELLDKPPGIEVRTVGQFRAWLASRLNKDIPWNEIVWAMLDARGTTAGDPALAYLLSFHRGRGLADEFAQGVSRHLLGIRLECARCHDHPYDKWRVEDYYGLGAFVIRQRARQTGEELELKYAAEGDLEIPAVQGQKFSMVRLARGGTAQPNYLFGGAAGKNDDQMQMLADVMTARSNPQLARAWANRAWGWLFGYGLLNPVDDFSMKNMPQSPATLEILVRDALDHTLSLKRLIRVLCATAAYQMPAPEELPEASTSRHLAKARVAQGAYLPLHPSAPALPVSFQVPAGWTRVAALKGARAIYLIPVEDSRLRNLGLDLFPGKLDPSRMASLRNQFESKPEAKEESFDGKRKVTWTEVAGRFRCAPRGEGLEDFLIFLAAFEAADRKPYYFRLEGPRDLVEVRREAMVSLLKNLAKGA